MKRICGNCRYWQRDKVGEPESCRNVDSDNRFDTTDESYSCNHWGAEVEQDGNVTWGMD